MSIMFLDEHNGLIYEANTSLGDQQIKSCSIVFHIYVIVPIWSWKKK